ncbi:LacI family DNA-binding transcriptional regulator [Pseudarthrobacter sp. NPDC058362]|uniref:LacI family DNA-binding transcriptional regulator n=1 Tax=Pseudarthrobacter sp. NPDC058362 TaxID=3346458 RepID=UPI00365DBEF8
MGAGIDEVAERAGVAASTVSRALRGLPGVSEGTRERIRQLASELGYQPLPSAARLATGVTGTVAVVVPDATKWFFGQVVSGAAGAVRAAGRDVLLFELGDGEGRRRFFIGGVLRGRADAVLVLSLKLSQAEVGMLRALDLPVVVLGQSSEFFGSVRVDERAAARAAVRHLLDLGHRSIAMIGIDDEAEVTAGSAAPPSRVAGYRQALLAAGITPAADCEQSAPNSVAGGRTAMRRLLAAPVPPTAVFVGSDEMAFGAMREAEAAGLEIPRDISFVGFDNHDFAPVMDLTTVDQDVRGQGAAAAELLVAALERRVAGAPGSESARGTRTVKTRLVVRGSTAAAARTTTNPTTAKAGN